MVASSKILRKQEIGRGGKSELRRAGWSVMRTVPVKQPKADFAGIRKVPQKHTACPAARGVLSIEWRVRSL